MGHVCYASNKAEQSKASQFLDETESCYIQTWQYIFKCYIKTELFNTAYTR